MGTETEMIEANALDMAAEVGSAAASATARETMGRAMDLLVAHEPAIHYSQWRPMRTRFIDSYDKLAAACRVGFAMDCSESVTLLCHVAGLQDPSGNGYDGWGNVASLIAHLRPHYTNPAEAYVGALCAFGSNAHVAMVRQRGSDPLLFTHGTERGPYFVRLSHLAPFLPRPVTFLSIRSL